MRWLSPRKRTSQKPPHPDWYPIKSGRELLSAHELLLQRIKRTVGVPAGCWHGYYQPCFEAFAHCVQAFPASEAHHHAYPGGMLEHSLEVVEHALKLRQGKLLPLGAEAEELAGAQDIWTYATVTAALCHDIGKPVVDLAIPLFASDGRELGQWSPWTNPDFQGACWYRVNFIRDRQFGLHEQASLLLAPLLIPAPGLAWLSSDRAVLSAWSASLYGESTQAGVLGEMIHQADGLSVAQNLSGKGGRTQMPSARQVPLSERLVTGLRYLLDQKKLPLNADGAAGWLLDDELWLVVKRTLDELKSHLATEGQTGIPGRNERLMDELQQTGVLIPNPQGKAIWKANVSGHGWPRTHTLTMLRFPAAHIWPDPDARPVPFTGTITPEINRENAEIQDNHRETSTEAEVWDTRENNPSAHTTGSVLKRPPLGTQLKTSGASALETLDAIDQSYPPRRGAEDLSDNADTPAADSFCTPLNRNHRSDNSDDETSSDLGEQFLHWLRQGLTEKTLPINLVNARVHRVPEGVLLVSPGIFKDFHPQRWSYVQKRFQRLKVNQKTAQRGENIHIYIVEGPKKKQRQIKGFLITDTARAFPGIALPDPNPHLCKLESGME